MTELDNNDHWHITVIELPESKKININSNHFGLYRLLKLKFAYVSCVHIHLPSRPTRLVLDYSLVWHGISTSHTRSWTGARATTWPSLRKTALFMFSPSGFWTQIIGDKKKNTLEFPDNLTFWKYCSNKIKLQPAIAILEKSLNFLKHSKLGKEKSLCQICNFSWIQLFSPIFYCDKHTGFASGNKVLWTCQLHIPHTSLISSGEFQFMWITTRWQQILSLSKLPRLVEFARFIVMQFNCIL